MALYIGLDIGTTGCKAGVFTIDGQLLSLAYEEHPVLYPGPGLAEQDPGHVWRVVRRVLAQACHSLIGRQPAEIRALSLSVQGDAVIPVDERGEALGPAVLGMDRRNIDECRELLASIGRERVFALTGMPVTPTSSLGKMMWLKRHSPARERIRQYWHYEEYILAKLGGKPLADYSMATRSMAVDLTGKDYIPEMLAASGIAREELPEAAPSGCVAGRIDAGLADELDLPRGLLLSTGGHDQACAALGAGAIREGLAVDSAGTAEVGSTALAAPRLNEGMLAAEFPCYAHVVPDTYLTFALIHSGGLCLRWLRDNLARAEAAEAVKLGTDPYDYLTARLPAGPGRVIFLPHLVAGGTPYGDQGTKGAFVGLTPATTIHDLVLAVLEGVAMELRVNIEALARAGIRIDRLRAVGGGARSERWLQLKADVLGCVVETPKVREAALLGAAMLAATACGEYAHPGEAVQRAVAVGRVYRPDAGLKDAYERHYEAYKLIYPALREVNHRLAPEGSGIGG